MKSPKISIVIPSYNKVRFIGLTLDSIIEQKYPNLEVIIQDSASTDGTIEIIKKYALKYPDIIKFESKKDKGQLDAINTGLKKSTGVLFTYINADDVYLPGAFAEVSKMYMSNSERLWFTGRGKVVKNKGEEIAKLVTWYKNMLLLINSRFCLLTTNYLMQPSVFITREALKKFGSFTGTPKFVMEYDLWLKISKRSVPQVSQKYFSAFRIEPSSISQTQTKDLLSEDEKIIKKYCKNPLIIALHKLHNLGRKLVGGLL